MSQGVGLLGASACVTCHRRLSRDFRERADGEAASHSTRTHFSPILPEDWCRYCSRARSEAAEMLEMQHARPSAPEIIVNVDARSRYYVSA